MQRFKKLSKSNAFSAINCLCQAKSRQNASNLFSSFPVSSFFPLSIRRVYQVIKAGIFNMLQIQNHPIELSEKPSINSVSFSIQSKEKPRREELYRKRPDRFSKRTRKACSSTKYTMPLNLLSYIQGMVDEDTNRRFVLSGSSQFAMLKKITQSLARRTAVFELLPRSCAEIRKTATGVRRSTIYCSADSIRQSARDATCLNSSIRRM